MKEVLVTPPPSAEFHNLALREYLESITEYIACDLKNIPYTIVVTPLGESKVDYTFDSVDSGKWHMTIELSPVQ